MRRYYLLLPLALVAGCASPMGSAPAQVSCQPHGYSPAPITFAYPTGATTAASAEQTAVAMMRACSATPDEASVTVTITNLTSSVKEDTGGPMSPNAGQAVWLVQIDTTEAVKGGTYPAHYWVEVNQATGVPTLIAYG